MMLQQQNVCKTTNQSKKMDEMGHTHLDTGSVLAGRAGCLVLISNEAEVVMPYMSENSNLCSFFHHTIAAPTKARTIENRNIKRRLFLYVVASFWKDQVALRSRSVCLV